MAKSNNNTLILIGGAALAYYLYEQSKKDKQQQTTAALETESSSASTTASTSKPKEVVVLPKVVNANSNFYPIKYNKYHPDVKYLQKALGVKQDGIVGPATLAAWKKYNPLRGVGLTIPNLAALMGEIGFIMARKVSNF